MLMSGYKYSVLYSFAAKVVLFIFFLACSYIRDRKCIASMKVVQKKNIVLFIVKTKKNKFVFFYSLIFYVIYPRVKHVDQVYVGLLDR